jgi:hypothetical protein
MNAEEHFEAAEKLLLSSQLCEPDVDGEQYPAREDGADAVGHALAAAQVHATLALAASLAPVSVTIQQPSRDGLVETFRRAQEVFDRRSS